MNLKTVYLLVIILSLSELKPLYKRSHASKKCIDAFKDDSSASDDFPDNETPIERTITPPNYNDPFLDQEAEDIYFPHGPPPIVNFIVIKHHFSNATNLAFPPSQGLKGINSKY